MTAGRPSVSSFETTTYTTGSRNEKTQTHEGSPLRSRSFLIAGATGGGGAGVPSSTVSNIDPWPANTSSSVLTVPKTSQHQQVYVPESPKTVSEYASRNSIGDAPLTFHRVSPHRLTHFCFHSQMPTCSSIFQYGHSVIAPELEAGRLSGAVSGWLADGGGQDTTLPDASQVQKLDCVHKNSLRPSQLLESKPQFAAQAAAAAVGGEGDGGGGEGGGGSDAEEEVGGGGEGDGGGGEGGGDDDPESQAKSQNEEEQKVASQVDPGHTPSQVSGKVEPVFAVQVHDDVCTRRLDRARDEKVSAIAWAKMSTLWSVSAAATAPTHQSAHMFNDGILVAGNK